MGRRLAIAAALGLGLGLPARAQGGASEVASEPWAITDLPVVEVEVHLPAGSDTSGITEQVAIHKGQLFSRPAVRRSLDRFFLSGRFAAVTAWAVRVPGGVKVVFDVLPKQKISQIQVTGNRALSTVEILEAARWVEGGEYFPERLKNASDAIVNAYHRRGYDRAEVSFEVEEGSNQTVKVRLTIDEREPTRIAGLTLSGDPGLGLSEVLSTLGLRLDAPLDRRGLENGLDRLRSSLREQGYLRAQVGDPSIRIWGGGATISLPINAGPRYAFAIHGNRSFRSAALLRLLGAEKRELWDRSVLFRMTRRLEAFYRGRGFHDARVWAQEIRSPDRTRAILSFEVSEGIQTHVRAVELKSAGGVEEGELRAVLEAQIAERILELPGAEREERDTSELDPFSTFRQAVPPPPASVVLEEAYPDAADAMTALYRERGFLQAKVSFAGVEISPDGGGAKVTFQISEGPKTVVRELTFIGAPPGVDLLVSSSLRLGGPMSEAAVERGRSDLLRALGRKGYLFAKVDAQTTIDPSRTAAYVRFKIAPGPQVRVGQVFLQGLWRTDERLVRAHLRIREGGVLDPDDLYQTQRALMLLGIFKQVTVRLNAAETEDPVKDVLVEVKERSRLSGDVGVGYSLLDGPRVVGDAVYPNLGGWGVNLSGRGKLNYVGLAVPGLEAATPFIDPLKLKGTAGLGGRANVALQWPRVFGLLPAEVGARLDVIGERVLRPAYQFTRFAVVTGLDWAIARWLDLSLQYELEHDRVNVLSTLEQLLPGGLIDEERLRFPVGHFTLQSVRPALTVDFRDDPVNPRSGLLLATTGELTGNVGTPTDPAGAILHAPDGISPFVVRTFKLAGSATVYLPVARRVVLALSGRGGKIFQLDPLSQTIGPKRFYLGGATTLRGFREDGVIPADQRARLAAERRACEELANPAGCTPAARVLGLGTELPSEGGEAFTLGKAELRFPAFGVLDMGLFFEAGNLWLKVPQPYPFTDLRYVAGAGVRYLTPIGPLAFDLGFNLAPDPAVNEPVFSVQFSVGLF